MKPMPDGTTYTLAHWARELAWLYLGITQSIEDCEDSETTFELTIDKLVKGIEKYYMTDRDNSFEEMDAEDADIIVQLGVHNEIIMDERTDERRREER